MSFFNLPAGRNIPEDLFAVIEISEREHAIKYEVHKEFGALCVDRFLKMPMLYPCNYGYINKTLGLDGDPLDILVITPSPVRAGTVIRVRPVGIARMEDEAGEDAKILAVPHDKVCPEYQKIKDIGNLDPQLLERIEAFFKHYKILDNGKWVKFSGFGDKIDAHKEILDAVERFSNAAAL